MLTLPQLAEIERQNPLLAETLRKLMNAINHHGTVVGVDPSGGPFPAPVAPSQIIVTSVAGGHDVSIVDANPQRGLLYFIDFDTAGSFAVNPRTVPLHTTRNVYLPLGTATYFFRAYSQYQGSNASPYTVFGGGTPIGVAGGAAGTPALGPTQGTGAGGPTGPSPFPPVGSGFGPLSEGPAPRNVPGGRRLALQ